MTHIRQERALGPASGLGGLFGLLQLDLGLDTCGNIAKDDQPTYFSNTAEAIGFVQAPTDLTIGNITAHSIELTWTIHTSDVPQYVLLFNDGTEGQGIIMLPSDATSYTLEGLELNRTQREERSATSAVRWVPSRRDHRYRGLIPRYSSAHVEPS